MVVMVTHERDLGRYFARAITIADGRVDTRVDGVKR
jgi:ABC-type lipoprotein export system ATPase subunit